jgi:antirestriction protein ArdC
MSWNSARSLSTERRDPIQEFADRIVVELEKGVKPWVRPWDPEKCGGPQAPFNPTTGARYHGINVLILGMHPAAFTTGDPRFMTYQQAQEKGWQVRKGQKATTIFFTKALPQNNIYYIECSVRSWLHECGQRQARHRLVPEGPGSS